MLDSSLHQTIDIKFDHNQTFAAFKSRFPDHEGPDYFLELPQGRSNVNSKKLLMSTVAAMAVTLFAADRFPHSAPTRWRKPPISATRTIAGSLKPIRIRVILPMPGSPRISRDPHRNARFAQDDSRDPHSSRFAQASPITRPARHPVRPGFTRSCQRPVRPGRLLAIRTAAGSRRRAPITRPARHPVRPGFTRPCQRPVRAGRLRDPHSSRFAQASPISATRTTPGLPRIPRDPANARFAQDDSRDPHSSRFAQASPDQRDPHDTRFAQDSTRPCQRRFAQDFNVTRPTPGSLRTTRAIRTAAGSPRPARINATRMTHGSPQTGAGCK